MIATSTSLVLDEKPKSGVSDPRRSYDRGVWNGETAEADAAGSTASRLPAEDDTPADLSKRSTAEIVAELRRREGRVAKLIDRRRRLAAQVADIDREIRELEDAPVEPAEPAEPVLGGLHHRYTRAA